MLIEHYTYKPEEYDIEDLHKESRQLFIDVIGRWEKDFHSKHPAFHANYLFGNQSTMSLIDHCLSFEGTNLRCGMEMIDGEINLDANMEIETYSDIQTVYGIDSAVLPDDLPLLLIIDNSLSDGKILLKYIPDDDDDDKDRVNEPEPGSKMRVRG